MEKITPTEVEEAKKFGEFFIDLLENHKENFIFYLADTAVLDWFGHTIKGPRDIGAYLKNNVEPHKQHFSVARPVRSIGFRESHTIKHANKIAEREKTVQSSQSESTEVNTCLPSTTVTQMHVSEIGQGDGLQNYEVLESPMKRCKLDNGQGDNMSQAEMKYLSTEGYVEFRKKSSKKFQGETKWSRPCKLEVAYCGNSFEDCTIYMIIYQGNMKCRRNLLKDFESCEPDD